MFNVDWLGVLPYSYYEHLLPSTSDHSSCVFILLIESILGPRPSDYSIPTMLNPISLIFSSLFGTNIYHDPLCLDWPPNSRCCNGPLLIGLMGGAQILCPCGRSWRPFILPLTWCMIWSFRPGKRMFRPLFYRPPQMRNDRRGKRVVSPGSPLGT